jgi:hypothetical protein
LKIEKVSNEDKALFRPILNRGSIYDSLAAYYLYEHPAAQIEIFGAFSGSRTPVGFLVQAQTGVDLFRPLLIPFVAQENVLNDLLHHVLTPERPVLLLLPLYQWEWVQLPVVLSNETRTEVFRLDPISYQPVLNVLVQHQLSPTGWPRYEIRHHNLTVAAAGVNWAGERFVEVYLDLEENPRELAFGKSVLAALSEDLLSKGKIPVLCLDDQHSYRRVILEEIGYQQTGTRFVMGQAVLNDLETGT